MANMFSGNNEKAIPQNLSECTKTNLTVVNLHDWSERLERWGKILFWILVGVGAIVSIAKAIETHEFRSEYSYELAELERLGTPVPTTAEVFFTNALTWALYAFIEYCAYHVLALLISALASITQNTMISANVALYEANKKGVQMNMPNSNVVSGNNANVNVVANRYTPAPAGMWACQRCGTHNKSSYGQCKHCGEYRK